MPSRKITNVTTAPTFARASAANENVNNFLASRPENERRKNDLVLSCSSILDDVSFFACTSGGVEIIPRIVTSEGVWGMKWNTDEVYWANGLGDGTSWTMVHKFNGGIAAGEGGFNMWRSVSGRTFLLGGNGLI